MNRAFSFGHLIVFFSLIGCSGNLFEQSVDQNTDDALYYDAERAIDANNYTLAIEKFGLMSDEFLADKTVQITRSTAYAGDCGFRFITFFDALSAADLTPFFGDLMVTFVDVAVTTSRCVQAEEQMQTVDASFDLESDEQFYYVILNLAKIGAILRAAADLDGTNSLGDGTTDASFDSCSSDSISDADVEELIISFSLFTQNVSALSGTISGIDSISNDLCGDSSPINTLCNATTSDEAQPLVPFMRDLLKTQAYGVEDCTDAGIVTCCI